MNIIKSSFFLSFGISAAVFAAQSNDTTDNFSKAGTTQDDTRFDVSDNRGMSLLFDETFKPGSVVISGVSKTAKQAGVLPGDLLKEICGLPANNLRAYGGLASAVGKDNVQLTIGRHQGRGNVPLSSVKIDSDKLVLSMPVQIQEGATLHLSTIPAGEEIRMVCLPIRSAADVMAVVAPFETRTLGAQMLAGGQIPMQYKFERSGAGKVVFVRQLTSWTPQQSMAALPN